MTDANNDQSTKQPSKPPRLGKRRKSSAETSTHNQPQVQPAIIKTKLVKRSKMTPKRGASTRGSVEEDKGRFFAIWAIMALGFAAVFLRLAYVQLINKDEYQAQGNKLITTIKKQPTYRGMITDRNNMPLAISAPLVTLVFSPRDYAAEYYALKAKQQALQKSKPSAVVARELARTEKRLASMDLNRLSALTHIDVAAFQAAVQLDPHIDLTDKDAIKAALPTGAGSYYFPLMKNVRPELAQPIIDAKFVGVTESKFYQRFYPQAQPNAQLLGFMAQTDDQDGGHYRGQAGVEKIFNDLLAGQAGKVLVMRDARNHSLNELEQVEPEIPGKDIQLTIDSRLQYLLYQELEKVGRLQQARWATGMIVDVNSGEVLALSNWPSYNPNDLNTINNENQRNHALIDVFEPGSVMKPVTVAIGMKSGQYNTRSLINTSPGSMKVGNYTIRDHGNLGTISLQTLLQKSSNVGSAKIALSLPPDVFSEGQKEFGFGHKTNLNFPGEAAGLVPTPAKNDIARRATVAYGYGLQTTLAQLAQAYTILGSGGILRPLTLIKSTKDNALNSSNLDNAPVPYPKPDSTRVLDTNTANAIVDMMVSVTEPGGTARLGAIDGYKVAGKTGTARRSKPGGGYYDNQYRTSFVGIAPASNPRFVAAIMVEDPQMQKFGGLVAAPVFREIMRETLRLYNVPFDKPLSGKEDQQASLDSVNDL